MAAEVYVRMAAKAGVSGSQAPCGPEEGCAYIAAGRVYPLNFLQPWKTAWQPSSSPCSQMYLFLLLWSAVPGETSEKMLASSSQNTQELSLAFLEYLRVVWQIKYPTFTHL